MNEPEEPDPALLATNEAEALLRLGESYTGYRIAPLVSCLRNGASEEMLTGALFSLDPLDLADLAVEALEWIAKVPFAPDKPS